eukprot:2756406-Pleurochrysis_carterae.AAC.2
MVYLCEPKQEAEIQSIREAESACTGAQIALLGEYQVASTDDEMVMALYVSIPVFQTRLDRFPPISWYIPMLWRRGRKRCSMRAKTLTVTPF